MKPTRTTKQAYNQTADQVAIKYTKKHRQAGSQLVSGGGSQCSCAIFATATVMQQQQAN